MENKIVKFDSLKNRINEYQKNGKKVVLCYGVFGILHAGHIRYVRKAKEYGDVLVVVITSDKSAGSVEEKYFESVRVKALAGLKWIDAVSVSINSDFEQIVKSLMPDVIAKGFESVNEQNNSTDKQTKEEELALKLGIKYVIVKEDEFFSSQDINKYISGFSESIAEYIDLFKQRYSKKDLLNWLDKLSDLKVLVIGDTILDEYVFCSAIGKSSKDPTLALLYEKNDMFAGGVLAVANHAANFAKQIDLISVLGERDSYEDFILSNIRPNIKPLFIYKKDAPTLIKKRFIDGYSTNKLFEVYVMDDSNLEDEEEKKLCNMLCEKLLDYDLVIIADYGHGFLSKNIIEVLSEKAMFLAVNTQANAGNRGFNTISKYQRADYVSLAEHEIRLETRDMTGKIYPMMKKIVMSMGCKHFAVTRGKKGCMLVNRQGALIQVPSFTKNVVDRVGAGDAFFVISSMLSAVNAEDEAIGFIGNIAGSLAVEIMGNEKAIDKELISQYLDRILIDE